MNRSIILTIYKNFILKLMFGIPFPGAFGHFAFQDADFEDEFED